MSNKILEAFEKYPSDTLYVGLDIAKAKHYARAVGHKCKKGTEAFSFSNDRKNFEKFLAKISRWQKKYECSKVVIGMEPTGNYGLPLEYFLKQSGFDVYRVSPLTVSRIKDAMDNSPLKSDKKDALLIAKLLSEGNVLTPSPLDENMETVKTCILTMEDLDKIQGQLANHMESSLAAHFPEYTKAIKDPLSVTSRVLLKEYSTPAAIAEAEVEKISEILSKASRKQMGRKKAEELCNLARSSIGVPVDNEAANLALATLIELYEVAEAARNKFKKILDKTLVKIPLYAVLRSVKGIGKMTAAAIIAFLGDLTEYDNEAQVLKKAGLNLFNRSSGSKYGTCHISRRGKGLLRRNLYMCCMVHTHKDSPFHSKYSDLKNRLRSHKKAMVALMRKTLRICFALARTNTMFDPGHEAKARAKSQGVIPVRAEKNRRVIRRSKAA